MKSTDFDTQLIAQLRHELETCCRITSCLTAAIERAKQLPASADSEERHKVHAALRDLDARLTHSMSDALYVYNSIIVAGGGAEQCQ